MATRALPKHRLTIDEFLDSYGAREGRWELVDGEPVMMAGANRRHGRVMRNLVSRIDERLRGGPCEVFVADMGVFVSETSYRLPDVAIFCDPRDTAPMESEPRWLEHPRVLIEVLSPSTIQTDRARKIDEYQRLPSVDTIILVNAEHRTFSTHERVSDVEWRTVLHMPGQPLVIRDPALVIPAEEIFTGL